MAKENPDQFHERAIMLFAAFLSDPPKSDSSSLPDQKSADTLEIMKAINERTTEQKHVEMAVSFELHEKLDGTAFQWERGHLIWRTDIVGSNLSSPPPA